MSQWTHEAIRGLGATTDLPTVGSIFGVSRWRAYQMAHTGEWEQIGVRVVTIGAKYRVVVRSILEVLGYINPSGTGHEPLHARPGHPQAAEPLRRPSGPAPSRAMGRIQEKK
jgi:hypothetical protein